MTADLQDLFDQAGRNPPTRALDADAVLRRARRSRNRRTTGAVAATVAVTLALVVGVASQRLLSADPVPAAPRPHGARHSGAWAVSRMGSTETSTWPTRTAGTRSGSRTALPAKRACGGYWGEGPLWSPDGRYLAYRGDGGEAVPSTCDRTVNISDSAGHRIASFPGDGWAIAWSPDSTRVAAWVDFYGRKLGIYGLDGVRQALLAMPPEWADARRRRPGVVTRWHVAPGPPRRGDPRRRVHAEAAPADDPRSQWMATYSPDGAEIAYISTDGLAVAAADGSQARVLVPGGLEDFPGRAFGPRWSPTGDRIAFVSSRAESRRR